MIPPLHFRWDGESMIPFRPRLADQHFVIGETYCLIEHHDRSANSHRHFFAVIADAWRNLPDDMLPEYPTAEALRKKMLVKVGYADERSIVCASKAEAQRVAAFIKPMDIYAVVVVREAVVRVFTAQSQSVKAMGAKVFQESKQAVLDAIDDLLGVERGATAKNAGQ
ncbi:MAG: hypothetical protein KJ052_17525, partial [Candidatus Hydrogenedentes bacterium]|nr:hypothetical protein [Candidatus Hydrogenedentota bacterium]